jgi:hypothetical protein
VVATPLAAELKLMPASPSAAVIAGAFSSRCALPEKRLRGIEAVVDKEEVILRSGKLGEAAFLQASQRWSVEKCGTSWGGARLRLSPAGYRLHPRHVICILISRSLRLIDKFESVSLDL